MKRYSDAEKSLERCKHDRDFKANFCDTTIMRVVCIMYNYSFLFALLVGISCAAFLDGWIYWVLALVLSLVIFVWLPLATTVKIKKDELQ